MDADDDVLPLPMDGMTEGTQNQTANPTRPLVDNEDNEEAGEEDPAEEVVLDPAVG